MEIVQGLGALEKLPAGSVLSIGNFDGVHRGHQHILSAARRLAHAPGEKKPIAIVTFEPHPLTVLRPEAAPPRLTPQRLKEALLACQQVNYLVVLPPEPKVLDLTAEQFWRIIRDKVRPAAMVEGESFYFGKGREGTIDRLRQWCQEAQITLEIARPLQMPLLDMSVVPVSSSLVRWLLGYGRARDAAICLGRPYELQGQVIRGHERGRSIGVPTANLDCGDQFLPADGVYAGRCAIGRSQYPAAVSIGTMPTFGENKRQVEAHLIGYHGDLYGELLTLELLDWLRDQRKFMGIDALKAQLGRDIEESRRRQAMRASEPIVSMTPTQEAALS